MAKTEPTESKKKTGKIRQFFNSQNAKLLMGVVLGLVLIVLISDLAARLSDLNRLTQTRKEIAVEVTAMLATRNALQTEIAYAGSDAAVIDYARGEGGMKQEGDNVVVPLPPANATPPPTPTPTPSPEPPENWEVWQALFFGE